MSAEDCVSQTITMLRELTDYQLDEAFNIACVDMDEEAFEVFKPCWNSVRLERGQRTF